MRARTLLILLALLSGIGLTVVALLGAQAPPPEAPVSTAPVPMIVVATSDLATGSLIKPQDIEFGPKPADVDADTVFNRPVANRPEDQPDADRRIMAEVVGAVMRRRTEVGQPIPRAAVVKPGDSGFLAAVLHPGMRAITVGVTAVSGAGGLIYPGDHVDVILTQTFPATDTNLARRSVSETVAQDLRVLAIDQQLQVTTPPGANGNLARTVTVEVDPRQAEGIAVATKLGELSLTIRSLDNPLPADGSVAAAPAVPAPAVPATGPRVGPVPAPGAPPQTGSQAVWAEDISPALRLTAQRPKAESALPSVLVIRGDSIQGGPGH